MMLVSATVQVTTANKRRDHIFSVTASDPEGDDLEFSLLSGPEDSYLGNAGLFSVALESKKGKSTYIAIFLLFC